MLLVILSGVFVSGSEANTESKDPAVASISRRLQGVLSMASALWGEYLYETCAEFERKGILRLREISLRELSLRSG